MPDLGKAACIAWLADAAPEATPRGAPAILPIEDAGGIDGLLLGIGRELDATRSRSGEALDTALLEDGGSTLRVVLAQLGIARLLRLTAWIDQNSERVTQAITQDEQSEAGRCLRATLESLNRQQLLARIFAPERLQGLLAVAEPRTTEAA